MYLNRPEERWFPKPGKYDKIPLGVVLAIWEKELLDSSYVLDLVKAYTNPYRIYIGLGLFITMWFQAKYQKGFDQIPHKRIRSLIKKGTINTAVNKQKLSLPAT